LERNRFKEALGGSLNALFSAAAMNLQKLLGFFFAFLFRLLSSLIPARSMAPLPCLA
jgi:hypothetical protein